MKYLKLILAGLLVIITVSQYFIYGFLDMMIVWLVYSLCYLAIGVYQKFHESSVRSQIFTLLYTLVPLAGLVIYEITAGLSKITRTFYIVFLSTLAAALLWEIVSLCLVIKEKRGDHPKRKSPPHTDHGIGTNS